MVEQLETTVVYQRAKLQTQLTLGRFHYLQWAQLFDDPGEYRAARRFGNLVSNSDTTLGLLQSEVALVGEDQGQPLLVVRPPLGAPAAFEHDYPRIARLQLGQRPDPIRKLVVGDVDPAPPAWL
jgi:hypothetical protein